MLSGNGGGRDVRVYGGVPFHRLLLGHMLEAEGPLREQPGQRRCRGAQCADDALVKGVHRSPHRLRDHLWHKTQTLSGRIRIYVLTQNSVLLRCMLLLSTKTGGSITCYARRKAFMPGIYDLLRR